MVGVIFGMLGAIIFVWHQDAASTQALILQSQKKLISTGQIKQLQYQQFSNYALLGLIIGGLMVVAARLLHVTERDSLIDVLTGLPNRRSFFNQLNKEVSRADRSSREFSVMILDVDHFKSVNDTYGHDTGDEVLRHIAQAMLRGMRSSDVVARYGGEEFVVLMPETPLHQSLQVAEKIRRIVSAAAVACPTTRKQISPTISAGVATFPADGMDANEILKKADNALYEAKQNGRNRVLPGSYVEPKELVKILSLA